MTNFIGRCACGAVQFSLEGKPLFTQHCHCNKCREVAELSQLEADHVGYSFTAAYLYKHFNVTQGESNLEELPRNNALLYLCKTCHTQIYGIAKDPSQREGLGVNANAIQIPDGYQDLFDPIRHVYYAFRKVDLDDDLPKFADMPIELGGTGKQLS